MHVFLDTGVMDTEEIMLCVRRTGGNSRVIDRIRRKMYAGRYNEGFTYSNRMCNESVMCIGMASSSRQLINTLAHEIRHLCDNIADEYMIPPMVKQLPI